jgi:hypothetical protein
MSDNPFNFPDDSQSRLLKNGLLHQICWQAIGSIFSLSSSLLYLAPTWLITLLRSIRMTMTGLAAYT